MTLSKPFLSDNAAAVHPRLWQAMQAADQPDNPYDGDALSSELDARFTALFGRECAALWVATGTAANCLALATMCAPNAARPCGTATDQVVSPSTALWMGWHAAQTSLPPVALWWAGGRTSQTAFAQEPFGTQMDARPWSSMVRAPSSARCSR